MCQNVIKIAARLNGSIYKTLCHQRQASFDVQAVSHTVSDDEALAGAFQADNLLGGFGGVQLKILLDIILENQRAEGFTACEIGAGFGGFTKQVNCGWQILSALQPRFEPILNEFSLCEVLGPPEGPPSEFVNI